MDVVGLLIGVVFFVLLEAFFSGSEIALLRTDKSKAMALYRKTGYSFLKDFHDYPEDYITLTMLGYTVSIVSASTFYTLAVFRLSNHFSFLQGYEALFSLTLVLFTLYFGELAPKNLFHKNADRLIVPSLWVLSKLKGIVKPLLLAVRHISRLSRKLLGGREEKLSRMDILGLLEDVSSREESLKVALKVILMKDTPVSELITPLQEVVMVEETATVDQVIRKMRESGYRKLPVYRTRVDNIVGYLDLFDLVTAKPYKSVMEFIRPVHIFSEYTTVKEVFDTFRDSREYMGIVVDELGITLGIVTYDDLIAFLMGGLRSEGHEEEPFVEVEKNRWVVDGRLEKEELEKLLGVKLPQGPFRTVAGFLLYQLRRIPKKGESITCCGYNFRVLKVEDKRISRLMVEKVSLEEKLEQKQEQHSV